MDTFSNYAELQKLFDSNFLDYTSYVIKERAIPDIVDGLKPVQRRIMQTLFNMDDGRFNKVANVVGDAMKLHPHGDASIYAALVNLANKGYCIDRQGNFGNIYTGDQASAARYIECRLSPLARETVFNKDLTEFVDSYDGRNLEPVTLPVKIPLLLLHGSEGIAVGMATKIMPHNFCELLEAQKLILQKQPVTLYPDFLQGGLVDISGYDHGNGRIKCRARIVEKNDKTIVIKDIPYTTTTQSLIESIEKAARSGKIKITSIDDYTAEDVEIEIKLARGIHAEDTIRALYAFTDCEVPISPNFIVIKDDRPVTMTVEEALKFNTEKLVCDLEKELKIELAKLMEKLHFSLLEQIFIEERLYKQIEECKSQKEVIHTIDQAIKPFLDRFDRDVTVADIERLLEIRIKRISRYDINKKHKDIEEIRTQISQVLLHLEDMVSYTIRFLDDLLTRYGHLYPRHTEIKAFQEVEIREVALSNLTVGYDRKDGFIGQMVKADGEIQLACSEYDKLLLFFPDGRYKVINVPDKTYVGQDLLWIGKAHEEVIFNIIYRDGAQNVSYIKRFHTPKFILEKEYRLFEEHNRSKILYFSTGPSGRIRVHLMSSRRSRNNSMEIDFSEYLVKGVSAIGKRISNRDVRRISEVKEAIEKEKVSPRPLPGLSQMLDSSLDQAQSQPHTSDKDSLSASQAQSATPSPENEKKQDSDT